ncbi:MAG: response regulator [Candidatus Rokubacteria bacterium]|nr:response regulator [Candidatus Rokubacteria bacterium]
MAKSTLDAVLAALSEPVMITDAEGAVTYANPAAVRRFGWDKLVGAPAARRLAEWGVRDPAGAPLDAEDDPIAGALATGRHVLDTRVTVELAPGHPEWFSANTVPLFEGDRLLGAVCVLHDITATIDLEGELEEARDAAEEANRLKDEFIAALSHELRTPLQPILGWTEVLRRHGRLDEVTAQALEAIRRNIRQQVRLVDDLLDLSRIVHGKFQLRFESFDLREQIKAAAEPFEEVAALRRIRLTMTLPPVAVPMWGDGARVQQIASNLIANAVKFTPAGGSIAVHLVASESEALLEVEDTGDGIAPEDIGVIFEAFRQGGATRRRGGLGLGLDLVKRLTEMHGGRVDAFSEGAGYGARFQVRLPLGRAEKPEPRRALTATRLDGWRILVVEDNADTRHVLKFMLEIEGASVEAVESGQEGIGRAEELRPQVVLCDIGLPDMDGLEVARRMRARPWSAETRLIALTGYGQPEDIRRALEAGFEAHLTKPINLDQLLALITTPEPA